jgi:hypothetical protein
MPTAGGWLFCPANDCFSRCIVQRQGGSRPRSPESLMSRAVFFGTLLFVGPFLSTSWAQDKIDLSAAGPRFPGGSDITFQWIYSCPAGRGCFFNCPGAGVATNVTKLTIYLGSIPVPRDQSSPAIFYEYSTREIPQGNGFSISTGPSTSLSCQVNGMTLDYSGPPK